MEVAGPLQVFTANACRFVVVGSAARALLGDLLVPRDLDVVVDTSPANRAALVAALDALDGRVLWHRRWVAVAALPTLPWAWGWTTRTPYGGIDVITRFIDGTTFEEHARLAEPTVLADGTTVTCHPTRRAA